MTENAIPTTIATDGREKPKDVTRRDVLTLAWKGLMGLGGLVSLHALWRYLSFQPEPAPPSLFDLGPAEQYPLGARAKITEAHAYVIHTETGFEARSLICPHLGCIVEMTEVGFECPCHGSRFGLLGELEHGPAGTPMRKLKLIHTETGHLVLDTRA